MHVYVPTVAICVSVCVSACVRMSICVRGGAPRRAVYAPRRCLELLGEVGKLDELPNYMQVYGVFTYCTHPKHVGAMSASNIDTRFIIAIFIIKNMPN